MIRRTGIVYDDIYLEHETGRHIERKERLKEITRAFEELDLWQHFTKIKPKRAGNEELELVHNPVYLEQLEKFVSKGGGWWDMDTMISPQSLEAARFAAGGSTEAVKAVLNGKVDNAMALVRPPGHHAEKDRAMGFCLVNNIAIAAQYAVENYGLERVAVVDWDVHHGNGTQNAFWERQDVLYLSCHQSPLFPGTGSIAEVGAGKGKGYTINVPLPRFTGDMGYYYLFKQLFEPIILDYQPQLILLSAGFDAHFEDPVGSMLVTARGFAKLTDLVLQWAERSCSNRLVLVLEGGYNLDGLVSAILLTLNEMAELKLDYKEAKQLPKKEFPAISHEAVDKVIAKQAEYWPLKR